VIKVVGREWAGNRCPRGISRVGPRDIRAGVGAALKGYELLKAPREDVRLSMLALAAGFK